MHVKMARNTTKKAEAHFERFYRWRDFVAFSKNMKALADTLMPCLRHAHDMLRCPPSTDQQQVTITDMTDSSEVKVMDLVL